MNIGVTYASFQSDGNVLVSIDVSNNFVKGFTIVSLVSTSSLWCKLSGPGVLLGLRCAIAFRTWSSVVSILSNSGGSGSTVNSGKGPSGSCVKTVAK